MRSGRQYLSPLQVMGRLMQCRKCSTLVDVIEIPEPTIDPDQYVCGLCLDFLAPGRAPAPEPPAPPHLRSAA